MPSETLYRIEMRKKDAILAKEVIETLQKSKGAPPGYAPVTAHLARRFKAHRRGEIGLRYGEAQLLFLALDLLRRLIDKTNDPLVLQKQGRCLEMLRRLGEVGFDKGGWLFLLRSLVKEHPEVGEEFERELSKDPDSERTRELALQLSRLVSKPGKEKE